MRNLREETVKFNFQTNRKFDMGNFGRKTYSFTLNTFSQHETER